jgi:hypothetical protein
MTYAAGRSWSQFLLKVGLLMRRILLVVLVFLGLGVTAFAQPACTPGYTNVRVDPDVIKNDIIAAIGAGYKHVTICLESTAGYLNGRASWSHGVDITQGAQISTTILGAGTYPTSCPNAKYLTVECGSSAQTVIYLQNSAGAFDIHPIGSRSNEVANIRFTWDNTYTDPAFVVILVNVNDTSSTAPVLIHHNDFIGVNACTRGHVIAPGRNHMVVYRNYAGLPGNNPAGCNFTPMPPPAYQYPSNNLIFIAPFVNDSGATWQTLPTYGTGDSGGTTNVYVEQNMLFNFGGGMSDLGNSSRVVFLQNEFHNTNVTGHGYDSGKGPRHVEILANHFYCDSTPGASPTSTYISPRSNTGRVIGNTFDVVDSTLCGGGRTFNPFAQKEYKASECISGSGPGGWPGEAPTSYPIAHMGGWGWNNGDSTYKTVGKAADQNMPGNVPAFWLTDGMQQSLEPWYLANNTNNTVSQISYIDGEQAGGIPSTCRAMAYSYATKASGTTVVVQGPGAGLGGQAPYATSGEQLVVVLADSVGGTTPTIASNTTSSANPTPQATCTFSSLATPVTNGNTRLSAWTCNVGVTGRLTVTATLDSSTAARALSVIVLRGVTGSPLDKHPAFATLASGNTFTAPATGTLSNANEIVISFFALSDTFSNSTDAGGTIIGPIQLGSGGDFISTACTACGVSTMGLNGTSGATHDVAMMVLGRVVNSTSSVTNAQMTDTNTVSGVGGVVTLLSRGSTANYATGWTPFDQETSQFIQYDREVYNDWNSVHGSISGFNGTSGTATGTKATLTGAAYWTSCTNGVGFWVTDEGTWNHSRSTLGGQGQLYTCASNAWSKIYTPYQLPHNLSVASILTQPASQTISSGSTATMSVVADNSSTSLSYQWYQGNARDYSTPIMGATSSSYTTPALTTNHNYWVDVVNSGGDADSVTATVTIGGGSSQFFSQQPRNVVSGRRTSVVRAWR